MTVVIPQKGDASKTRSLQFAKCVLSGDTTGDTLMYDVIIGSGDSAAVSALFTFPNGAYILDVGFQVVTAFVASQTLTLGDTDSAAAWANAAAIGATVADTEINWTHGLVLLQGEGIASTTATADTASVPIYGIHGRTMVADTIGDPISLNVTVAGAVPSTGVLDVFVAYLLPFGKSST